MWGRTNTHTRTYYTPQVDTRLPESLHSSLHRVGYFRPSKKVAASSSHPPTAASEDGRPEVQRCRRPPMRGSSAGPERSPMDTQGGVRHAEMAWRLLRVPGTHGGSRKDTWYMYTASLPQLGHRAERRAQRWTSSPSNLRLAKAGAAGEIVRSGSHAHQARAQRQQRRQRRRATSRGASCATSPLTCKGRSSRRRRWHTPR